MTRVDGHGIVRTLTHERNATMGPENELPLLLSVAQVARLVGYRRSKIYEMMREQENSFPAQACRGRWRRTDIVRWVAELGKTDTE